MSFLFKILKSKKSIIAPEVSLMIVKLVGSIKFSPSAILQSTEFAANAISERDVSVKVLIMD